MNTASIVSLVNIAFIAISVAAAYVLPFELLLFSYAVLGPAHYLTEISWLHDRNYFTTGKWDYVILTVLCVLNIILVNPTAVSIVFLLAFFGAGLMAYLQRGHKRTFWLIALTLSLLALQQYLGFGHTFSLLVATVIHVYLFTGAFILLGALRRKSVLDLLTLVLFIGAAAIFFLLPPDAERFIPSESVARSLTIFELPTKMFQEAFGIERTRQNFITVMAFFAFAYTYHYLNWFSKTNLIRWHQIPRKRLVLIVSIYAASLWLYHVDYLLGFQFLLFLSLLHVFLELPLNYRTFADIGRMLTPKRT